MRRAVPPVGSPCDDPRLAVIRDKLRNVTAMKDVCGVSFDAASLMFKGLSPGQAVLDAAWTSFCASAGSDLELQLMVLRSKPKLFSKVVSMLSDLASLVERHAGTLHAPDIERRWIFPPTSALASMSSAIGVAICTLRQLHSACPELDELIYAKTGGVPDAVAGRTLPKYVARRVAEDTEAAMRAFMSVDAERQETARKAKALEKEERRRANREAWRKAQEERDRLRRREKETKARQRRK